MNKRMRLVALFIIACFGLLVAQLTNLQVKKAGALNNLASLQPSAGVDPWTQPRGEIVSADGVVLAKSVPSGNAFNVIRDYPHGKLFADVTGYYDPVDRSVQFGIEQQYSAELSEHEPTANNLNQLITEQEGTDNVVLTIDAHLQQVAKNALDGLTGAVVAIVPSTGAVLVMYSNPTYNPNGLASESGADLAPKAASSDLYYKSLDPDSYTSPLVNFATDHPIAPGSTFKVVTTSAIYDHDPTEANKVFPSVARIKLPQTNLTLQNFGGEVCGGKLPEILAKSCDTSYAQVGLDIGAPALADEALSFGFNKRPPIDLPSAEVAAACFPPAANANGTAANPTAPTCPGTTAIGPSDQPVIAYSAIGQQDVTETALQNALNAAAIGNNGIMMTPHLMASIIDDSGTIVTSYHAHPWLTATSAVTATTVRSDMLSVAEPGGTAGGVFPPSLDVAAKTGTAETGLTECSATWLMATAPAGPTDTPQIAVAVVVPAQSGIGCSETGAEVAGPIVNKVISSYLATNP